jgi:hypothetical protein
MFGRRTHRWLVLLCLAILVGCSNTFIYNRLDWLIPWYVDDYVDLNRAQKSEFKVQLRGLLDWHRSDELEPYVGILGRIERDLERPVDRDTVQSWMDLLLFAWQRIEDRILPIALDLGDELSEEQMAEFIEALWDKQADYEKEYLSRSDAEYAEDLFERLQDNLSDQLGRLTPQQKDILLVGAGSLQRFDHAWLEDRRAWHMRLQELLKREPGWQTSVTEALAARDGRRSGEYTKRFAHNQDVINGVIADVINRRNAKQSIRLGKELKGMRRDLETLINRAD